MAKIRKKQLKNKRLGIFLPLHISVVQNGAQSFTHKPLQQKKQTVFRGKQKKQMVFRKTEKNQMVFRITQKTQVVYWKTQKTQVVFRETQKTL